MLLKWLHIPFRLHYCRFFFESHHPSLLGGHKIAHFFLHLRRKMSEREPGKRHRWNNSRISIFAATRLQRSFAKSSNSTDCNTPWINTSCNHTPPGYDTAVSGLFTLTLPNGCPTPPFDRAFQSQRQNKNSTRNSSASNLLEGYDNRGFMTQGNVPRTPPPKYETIISFSWQGLFWNYFSSCVQIVQF